MNNPGSNSTGGIRNAKLRALAAEKLNTPVRPGPMPLPPRVKRVGAQAPQYFVLVPPQQSRTGR